MRKFSVFLLFLWMLFYPLSSYADNGVKKDGSSVGAFTDISFRGNGGAITLTGSDLVFNLAVAGVGNGGGTSMITTDTAVPVTYGYVRKHLSSTTNVVLTLADGKAGQLLTLYISEVDSSGTALLRPTTNTGYVQLTFNAADDFVTLLYVDDTTGWVIIASNSVTVGH